MNASTTQILRHLLILKSEAQRPPESTIKFIEDFQEALSTGTLEIKEGIGNWIELDLNDHRTWPDDGETVIIYKKSTGESYSVEAEIYDRGVKFYHEDSYTPVGGVTHWTRWPSAPTD